MDDEINISAEQIQALTPEHQRELQAFLNVENQKAAIQKNVHDLSELCFKKCVTSSISSGKLTTKEEFCMANCVNRFLDSNIAVLKHLELLRSSQ